MDDKTKKILELLKYHNASDLKSIQTKFTKTANAIKREAVQSRLSILYTDKELDILTQAAEILTGTKRKIEHAKEVKEREEKRLEKLEKEYEIIRKQIFDKYIKFNEMAPVDILIMVCAVDSSLYCEKQKAGDIEDLFSHPKRFKIQVQEWQREIFETVVSRLFPFRQEPEEHKMVEFLRKYNLKYRKETADKYSKLIDRLNTFLAIQNGENIEILKK